MQNVIEQGADMTIEFTVRDQEGSTVNLSSYQGMAVILLDADKKVVAKFAVPSRTGFEDLALTTPEEGKCSIYLRREITKDLKPGIVTAEIKAQSLNEEFDDNRFFTVKSGIEVALCTHTVSKNISDLGS